jgi:hypothetical protein
MSGLVRRVEAAASSARATPLLTRRELTSADRFGATLAGRILQGGHCVIEPRLLFTVLVSGFVACRSAEREPLVPASLAVPAVSVEAAALKLALVRCSRRERCGLVGQGREFGDREQCIASLRQQAANDLAPECRQGVREIELEWCLNDVRTRGCAGLISARGGDEVESSCVVAALCTS